MTNGSKCFSDALKLASNSHLFIQHEFRQIGICEVGKGIMLDALDMRIHFDCHVPGEDAVRVLFTIDLCQHIFLRVISTLEAVDLFGRVDWLQFVHQLGGSFVLDGFFRKRLKPKVDKSIS